jgi:AraC family transcriptional regulator
MMDSCPNYDRLYNPFRADGAKAARRKLATRNLIFIETIGAADFGVTAPVTAMDAVIVQLSLTSCARSELFVAEKHIDGLARRDRSVLIHDLRRSPVSEVLDPFHVLYFYLPQRVLDTLCAEMPGASIDDMHIQPQTDGGQDPAIEHLMLSVVPALDRPDQLNGLFAEHVTLALAAHVFGRYRRTPLRGFTTKGGLAPRQQRRALEMLHSNLHGAASLSDLATECGLSVRHFARAFKETMGTSPHRYLLKRRVETARRLLLDPKRSLLDIALACGFADQSHFTRVFTAAMDISPGALRRELVNHDDRVLTPDLNEINGLKA